MLIIVIPAYNEEKTVREVVRQVHNTECFPNQHSVLCVLCIVVDDGSTDRTAEVASRAGALVLSHPINRGLGAALATGIEAALVLAERSRTSARSTFDIIVTLDADGQHDPTEIPRLIEPILQGEADVVIGSRFLRHNNTECFHAQHSVLDYNMPLSRRVANWFGNFATWLLFGLRVTDSQSGFRAFSREAAKKLRIRTNTMEVSSEIIREIKFNNLRLKEVPITPIYTDYSLSKGQSFLKGLETLWKLIVLKFFR